MATPKRKTPSRSVPPQASRLWLMFPARLIKKPVIWELGHKFDVITNVRQVSVADDIGIACLELEGVPTEVAASVRWLRKQGVNVEPVELATMES